MSTLVWPALAVFFLVVFAVGVYRKLALAKGWFDVPNARSSHLKPVPGGAGIVLALVLVLVLARPLLFVQETVSLTTGAMLGLAFALSVLGWLDDRFGLPTLPRAIIFLLAALSFAFALFGNDWLLVMAVGLGVFGYVNFFNFMDGTDGIAASQCLFVSLGLLVFGDCSPTLTLYCSSLASASAAFLFWNWAPAKVFMGDAGSLFCGFLLAALAVHAHSTGLVHISVSLMLNALFIAEPLTVMCLRAANGENITVAHRSHLYQLLALRWHNHQKVALCYSGVNFAVLLPLAFYIQAKSTEATIITVTVFCLLCLIVGILRHRLLLSGPDKI